MVFRGIVHPRLLDALGTPVFDRTITVQRQTQAVSAFGEAGSTWTDRQNLQNVKARISALNSKQMEAFERSGYIITHMVKVPNYHTSMLLQDRLRDDASTSIHYDVRIIDYDSALTMTNIGVRRVAGPVTT